MATSRLASAKTLARRTPLLSFLARESPSTLTPTGEIVAVPFSSPINPFAPSKPSPNAKSWTAPKYSIRRQKQLRREAQLYGLPEEILPPPFIRATSPSPSHPINPQQRLLKGTPHVPETKILDKLLMEKAGPYAGRKGAAFKGKIWERKKEQRLADLKKLLEGADAKAQAWKKVSLPSITLRNHRLTFSLFLSFRRPTRIQRSRPNLLYLSRIYISLSTTPQCIAYRTLSFVLTFLVESLRANSSIFAFLCFRVQDCLF